MVLFICSRSGTYPHGLRTRRAFGCAKAVRPTFRCCGYFPQVARRLQSPPIGNNHGVPTKQDLGQTGALVSPPNARTRRALVFLNDRARSVKPNIPRALEAL